MLAATGISKRFGAVRALVEASIAIPPGEIVALAGENGSGKSTLARILAGALVPDAGQVRLNGESLSCSSPREGLDAGVALVAQDLTDVPEMSVAENVLLTRLRRPAMRVRRRELVHEARPLLEAVGLDIDPRRPFCSLAAGQRELAEVAKALASRPRVLILDEATSRLQDAEVLLDLADRLRSDGMAVLFITHRLREIRRLADRVVVLRDGRVVGQLDRREINDERVSSMMVGRELSDLYPKRGGAHGKTLLRLDGVVPDGSNEAISLSVRAGEIVGLGGLVGSGRSELLETVAGVRRRRGGDVFVGDDLVPSGSIAAARSLGVALVPEDRHRMGLVMRANVRENLALPTLRTFALVDRGKQRARAVGAIDRFGIRCAGADAEIRTLSGGNQQKVVLARCIMGQPRVLLLDEPTRGVDVGARAHIYKIIGDMAAAGLAVVITSAELPELIGLCDRVVVLHEGAVAGELARSEATEERIMLLSGGGAEVARGAGD